MKTISTQFHQQSQEEPKTETEQEEKEEGNRSKCDWDFTLSTIVSSNAAAGPTTDTLGVVEFDPSDSVVATGGIARKIRVYRLKSLLPHENSEGIALLDHSSACEYYMCTPAKLSSLRWRPGSGGRVLGSGDYDGVVMEYDLERRVPIYERDEHGGRRVWSMGYSHWEPAVGASGSDDGTMQMWDPRCEGGKCVAMVQPSMQRSPVCCVEFNPFGGSLLAIGCADRRAYGYDVRKMGDPVLVFEGHQKTVTYVRFLDHHTVVTSGTDERLMLWQTEDQSLIRTYKGHVNARRFVGLSVWRNSGLICCGSESNQVFVYDKRWGEPIWVHGFEPVVRAGCDRGFVSSVCWRQVGEDGCTLVAGGSDGVLQVFVGKRKAIIR
ncbi:WD repeat-containing protein RUP2 [Cornus florida]|uniref:WD repeat-containing protein RUP2 n=1 Tax=Cornus florida TaxID=4283 RepID=UPI00289BD23B|nr:WD repeat-containing protein RUP2 [Cornus florida]